MTIIQRRGQWFGTEASDIDAYLDAFAVAAGDPIERVIHAACGSCGGTVFDLELDDSEGFALRVCTTCRNRFPMLDSAQYEHEVETGDAACPCGREQFELAVGFALRDDGDVRWVYVAARCVSDGLIGVYVDWSIDYSPTDELFTQV